MKHMIAAVLVLASASALAEEIISFGKPSVRGPLGTVGDSRSVSSKSDLDGVCRYLGANEYIKGSVHTSRERYLSNCGVSTFGSDTFAVINADGRVEREFKADTYETINSRLGRINCIEYLSRQKVIHGIKCIKH